MQQIPLGSIGIYLVVEFLDDCSQVDLHLATSKQIILKKPDGTQVVKTASFRTDGTDGQIQYYTLSSSDLDPVGMWKIQGRATLTGVFDWRTLPLPFEVVADL